MAHASDFGPALKGLGPGSSVLIGELFLERGLAVDHATLNRWVLAYAPLIERRLRAFRKPHCGSIRIDETNIKQTV